jgi:hypothetical protein
LNDIDNPIEAPPTPTRTRLGGPGRLATALLAAGLVVVGGSAAVMAADPSPTPALSAASDPATDGSTPPARSGHAAGQDCPDSGGSGDSGGTGGDQGSPTTPDATDAPSSSADPADV